MPIHDGRKKDSWQIPHKNRGRYSLNFHMRSGEVFKFICAVGEPVLETLKKRRDEIIAANLESWVRPWMKKKFDREKKVWISEKALDKEGRVIYRNALMKVTADFLGADI